MLPTIAPLAASALIAGLWQGFLLAATVWLCLRLAPRSTAALRFALWTGALVAVCLLPLLPHAPRNAGSHAGRPSVIHPVQLDPRWSYALAAVWLALSLARGADLLRHAARLRALGRHAAKVKVDARTSALLQASHRCVQVCTSNDLERPGVIGFFRPRVLIPAWLYRQLTAPELEQIVMHELEHLRRGDDWLNLLQKVTLVLFPLNPALHWIERRLCVERELACDEGVVRRTRTPRLYAACLAKLAERGLDRRGLSLALGFLERQSELGLRVGSILRGPRTLSRRAGVALSGAVAVLLLGGSVELARGPQLVSFAAAPALTANISPAAAWTPAKTAPPVLYTDATTPRLLDAALRQAPKAQRKAKLVRAHRNIAPRRAAAEQNTVPATPPVVLASGIAPQLPALLPATPTLVRYTLVRVDGAWILVQL